MTNTDALFKALQAAAAPAQWSRGIALTRGDTLFLADSLRGEEIVIRVKIKNQALSPKVLLLPVDLDWDCDCGANDSPCAHIVGALLALRQGNTQEKGDQASVGAMATLEYHFYRGAEGLGFERLARDGAKLQPIPSLTAYIAGLESGRLQGAAVAATKADYAIDPLFSRYVAKSPLSRSQLEGLFKNLEIDNAIFLDGKKIEISTRLITVRAECIDEGEGYRLRKVKNEWVTEVFRHGVALCGETLRLIAPTQLSPEENKWIAGEGSYWGPAQEQALGEKILPALEKKIPVDRRSLKLPQSLDLPPRIDLLIEKAPGPDGRIGLSVLANLVYGNPALVQLNPNSWELVTVKDRATQKLSQIVQRRLEDERSLIQKLSADLQLQIGRRIFLVDQPALDLASRARHWNPRGDGLAAFLPEERELLPQISTGSDEEPRFAAHFSMGSGAAPEARAEFQSVFKAWQAGEDHVPLLDGSWAKIPKNWLAQHGKKVRDFLLAKEATSDVPNYRLPELAQLCQDLGVRAPASAQRLQILLNDFRGIPTASLPAGLKAELRPYQQRGLDWLRFLSSAGLGALLADDMGLGKTLQTICALEGKCLVVAPTSVLFNWAAEVARFRSNLKVCLFYGARREIDPNADVVLTSYGLLRLEQERLLQHEWDCVVLDEAQNIKNPESQVAVAAHQLRARWRVALSGTPVENRLDDLWSQFQFLNPGLLGTREEFSENFARPMGRGDSLVAQRLKSRVKPFILRRLKREVAPELPPRSESILHCELSSDERATYEALLAATRQDIVSELDTGGSVIKALELILRLRQACCHSALLPGQSAQHSSKVELLMDSLDEAIADGHRSLVFSQWTSYLDLIAAELKGRGINHLRIDGGTANRGEIVKRFQDVDGPPLMLISLKAGGVGLNLTAADHVYIMDPWWNPAVEDQAADRAHRIGQTNPVMIHRLVAKDTIEEKIILLQEKKKDLARAVLEEGGAALSLSRQDILDLLT